MRDVALVGAVTAYEKAPEKRKQQLASVGNKAVAVAGQAAAVATEVAANLTRVCGRAFPSDRALTDGSRGCRWPR